MVGAALICVARTHTIAIRKFICQLECDAYLHDQKLRAKLYNRGSRESRDSLKSKNIFGFDLFRNYQNILVKARTNISLHKVEKILKGSLDWIPSPSVKIQIMGGKVCLNCIYRQNISGR